MGLNRQDARKMREWKIRKISHKEAQEAQEGTEVEMGTTDEHGWTQMEEVFLRRGLSMNTACVRVLKNLVLSVWSVWSVVFVGTTEYTEYTEREGAVAGVLCLRGQFSGICVNLRNLRFPPLLGHPCLSVSIRGSFPFSVSWRSWRFNQWFFCCFVAKNLSEMNFWEPT
jgi:hypothetical protein